MHYTIIATKRFLNSMRRARLSQHKLAKLAGFSPRFVKAILEGTTVPTESALERLCKYLDVGPNDLYVETPPASVVMDGVHFQRLLESLHLSRAHLARELGVRRSTVHTWVKTGVPAPFAARLWSVLQLEPPSAPVEKPVAYLDEFSRKMIERLQAEPDSLYTLPPRRFEELVAELMADMGYDVRLTPSSRDHGRDVLAALPTPVGEILTLVECKRFRRDRKVGSAIVERFLFTIRDRDKANLGIIVTTSFFTRDARSMEDEYAWLLKLHDYETLRRWLERYGTWSHVDKTDLWLPTPHT